MVKKTVEKLLHCSKVKLQGHGHKVKNNGTHRKVLSQGILMRNTKALTLFVQKLLARLKSE